MIYYDNPEKVATQICNIDLKLTQKVWIIFNVSHFVALTEKYIDLICLYF